MSEQEPTPEEMRAMLLELDAAKFRIDRLKGRNEGMADLSLRLPNATVRRLWAMCRALKPKPEAQPSQPALPLG